MRWSGNLTTGLGSSYMSITVANANNAVDARVRARNVIGTSGWSTPTAQVSASDIADQAGSITQRHRFTTSQTWNWPYDDLDSAVAVITGRTDSIAPAGRDATRDITLGAGNWVGGVSDGTTLWFVNTDAPDTAYAYNASTRARDAATVILRWARAVGAAVHRTAPLYG